MNRRHYLIALAVAVSVAVFVPAKIAASWRPVKLADIQQRGDSPAYSAEASSRYIVLRNHYSMGDVGTERRTLFDIKTATARELAGNEGIVGESDWRWELQTEGDKPQLLLRQGDALPVAYALRPDNARQADYSWMKFLRVRPSTNHVELLLSDRLYRWNKTTGKLERSVKLAFNLESPMAISRDGATLLSANTQGIRLSVARTGYFSRTIPVAGVAAATATLMTPFGEFAFYGTGKKWPPNHWQVADAKSGRVLWSFEQDSQQYPIFSSDEKELAFFISARKLWEIHALRTGALLRTLPLVPGTTAAALSPDGATLYSIAGGVLYRQRAR